ncbi:MAG: zinc ribbon domain-containing protein [Methanothermobacter tenebrarum]
MKNVSFGLIGICILLFLLPWISMSCQGTKVATLSGFDLAVGKEIGDKGDLGGHQNEKIRDTRVGIVLAVTILVFILFFVIKDFKKRKVLAIILGIFGFVFLLLFKFSLDNQVAKEAQGMIQVSYLVGYWLALFTYPLIALFNFLIKGEQAKISLTKFTGDLDRDKGEAVFCPRCGSKLSKGDKFCPNCGHKIKEA